MNTATVSGSSGSSNVSQSQSKTSSTAKSSEKSFDAEMKTVAKTDENTETKNTKETEKNVKESKIADKKAEKKDNNQNEADEIVPHEIYNGEISYADFKYHNEGQSVLSRNIQHLLDTKDLMNTINSAHTVDYDAINMSDEDANFFANLVQNTDMSMKGIMNDVGNELVQNNQNVQKNIQVSSVLMEKLAESLRTNQPFRIDFDKDVSVIIKVNKDGSLSANFIPGDKAVEQYLRNNIDSLRQRFDEEDLPYSQLSYSNSKEGRQQRSKKENDNE
ncbi:hypothetical protein J6P92_03300 [bacterium]|nr:hypothetical protein [bacterium]